MVLKFEIVLSQIKLDLLDSYYQSCPAHSSTRVKLEFNVGGHHTIQTSITLVQKQKKCNYTWPAKHSFYFQNAIGLNMKQLVIKLKEYRWIKDKTVGKTKLNLHTIASGPQEYKLFLFDSKQSNQVIGTVEFNISMIEVCSDIKVNFFNVQLSALDLTQVQHKIPESFFKKTKIDVCYITLQYLDDTYQSNPSQYVLDFDKTDYNIQEVIPYLSLTIPPLRQTKNLFHGAIVGKIILQNNREEMFEYGLFILPLMYFYDAKHYIQGSKKMSCPLFFNKNCQFTPWPFLHTTHEKKIHFDFQIENGPDYVQMEQGYCDVTGITKGACLKGFCVPNWLSAIYQLQPEPVKSQLALQTILNNAECMSQLESYLINYFDSSYYDNLSSTYEFESNSIAFSLVPSSSSSSSSTENQNGLPLYPFQYYTIVDNNQEVTNQLNNMKCLEIIDCMIDKYPIQYHGFYYYTGLKHMLTQKITPVKV